MYVAVSGKLRVWVAGGCDPMRALTLIALGLTPGGICD